MAYSQDFKNKVKAAYPDSKEIHRLVDNNQYFLGRLLDDSSQGGINVDEILLATSLDVLKKKALSLKIRKEVYSDWWHEKDAVK